MVDASVKLYFMQKNYKTVFADGFLLFRRCRRRHRLAGHNISNMPVLPFAHFVRKFINSIFLLFLCSFSSFWVLLLLLLVVVCVSFGFGVSIGFSFGFGFGFCCCCWCCVENVFSPHSHQPILF